MSWFNKPKFIKNMIKEQVDFPVQQDLLNTWVIPKVNIEAIYKLGTFEKFAGKTTVKTTELSFTMDKDSGVFHLLSQNDIDYYKSKDFNYLHIGLVQVAFKPLTLKGLPESFVAALRDGRNLNWKNSLIGSIQSTLAYGAIYFNAYPNLNIALTDVNILQSLILNIKINGYDYLPGTEVMCICTRIVYRPLYTLSPRCKIAEQNHETVLFENNFSKSKIITRRLIKWEEINFPTEWIIEEAAVPREITSEEISDIRQSKDGSVTLSFKTHDIPRLTDSSSRLTRSVSSYISPVDYIVDIPSRASTSQIRDTNFDKIILDNNNIAKGEDRLSDPTDSDMNFPTGLHG